MLLLFVWKAVHRGECEEESCAVPLVILQGHMFLLFLFIMPKKGGKWLESSKKLLFYFFFWEVLPVQGSLGATLP